MNDKTQAPAARPARSKALAAPSISSGPTESPAPPKPAPRARRQASEVKLTVAKHQKVLADALAKAQAINYDQPKVMPPAAFQSDKAVKSTKERPPKARKPKLIRDSFAMPEAEYARIDALKQRLAALGQPAKKSEVLRGGIAALCVLDDSALKAVMGRIERIKTGRPNK